MDHAPGYCGQRSESVLSICDTLTEELTFHYAVQPLVSLMHLGLIGLDFKIRFRRRRNMNADLQHVNMDIKGTRLLHCMLTYLLISCMT